MGNQLQAPIQKASQREAAHVQGACAEAVAARAAIVTAVTASSAEKGQYLPLFLPLYYLGCQHFQVHLC